MTSQFKGHFPAIECGFMLLENVSCRPSSSQTLYGVEHMTSIKEQYIRLIWTAPAAVF